MSKNLTILFLSIGLIRFFSNSRFASRKFRTSASIVMHSSYRSIVFFGSISANCFKLSAMHVNIRNCNYVSFFFRFSFVAQKKNIKFRFDRFYAVRIDALTHLSFLFSFSSSAAAADAAAAVADERFTFRCTNVFHILFVHVSISCILFGIPCYARVAIFIFFLFVSFFVVLVCESLSCCAAVATMNEMISRMQRND